MKLILLTLISLCIFLGVVRAADKGMIQIGLEIGSEVRDVNESYIVLNAEQEYVIEKGGVVEIPLEVFRGKTLKRTVYVWAVDSDNKTISGKAKVSLPERFTEYNLTANLTFPKCIQENPVFLVAEGLDTIAKKQVLFMMSGCDSANKSVGEDREIEFSIISSPEIVESGSPFRIRIMVSNPTEQHLDLDAWSYVYRSSVSYSGNREENMKTINIPEFSNVTFDLKNTVDAPEGNYSIKIKLLRSDRKAPHEITLPLFVSASEQAGNQDSLANDTVPEAPEGILKVTGNVFKNEKRTLFSSNVSNSSGSGSIVYLSSSAKAQRMAVYFLIVVLALVLIALIFRRL